MRMTKEDVDRCIEDMDVLKSVMKNFIQRWVIKFVNDEGEPDCHPDDLERLTDKMDEIEDVIGGLMPT